MNKIILTIFLTATFNLFYAEEGLQINQDVYPFEDKATEQLFYSLLFELGVPNVKVQIYRDLIPPYLMI